MDQLYFVRHANADYLNDCITPSGKRQMDQLISILDQSLPESLDCVLVSSPSGRAMKTANGFVPMLTRKTGREISIVPERGLDQIRSIGSVEEILQNGRENVGLIEKYHSSEYGFFISHDKIIVATSLAIAEKLSINIPEFLRLDKEIDQSLVNWMMNQFRYTKEVSEKKLRECEIKPLQEIPEIEEASAIHIDLQKRQIEYITR